jgi:hypothetical protein
MKRILIASSLFFGVFRHAAHRANTWVSVMRRAVFCVTKNDSLFNIADWLGKEILVIYFYPGDEAGFAEGSLFFPGQIQRLHQTARW